MKRPFDGQEIGIDCPECGHRFSKTIEQIKTSPKHKCHSCGTAIHIDGKDVAKTLRKIGDPAKNLAKEISRINKNLKF